MKTAPYEVKPLDSRFQDSRIRNVYGTLAAEGLPLSESTLDNLNRIATGQASSLQVLDELREKYAKRG